MMLKTRINRKSYLKVLLWIDMGCGALHASAQNEVRDEDCSSLTSYFNPRRLNVRYNSIRLAELCP
ncbi:MULTISPECIES: hypothetical protein [Bacteroides]|uniref:hypothetical protein n=1 Tax=Bacteroides TaxID=816 RepID=UPI00319D8B1A